MYDSYENGSKNESNETTNEQTEASVLVSYQKIILLIMVDTVLLHCAQPDR